MADLSGSFSSIHFAPLAQFLASLGKTGDLLVSHERWTGQLSLQDGRFIAASIDDEHGHSALELIVAGVSDRGTFEFFDGAPSRAPELDAEGDVVQEVQRLGASPLQGWMTRLRGPGAIPRLVVTSDLPDELEITLTRAAIRLFLDIDGQRSIQELVRRHGLRGCVTTLQKLCELGLVEIQPEPTGPSGPPPGAASPAPPPPDTRPGPGGPATHFARMLHTRAVQVGGELLQAVLVAGALVFAGRIAMENFRVEGISMQPNFRSGQVLVVNRLAYLHVDGTPLAQVLPTDKQGSVAYLFGGPQRGDVAIFASPVEPEVDYIKRVIGLPGDRVAVRGGRVYVNDAALTNSAIGRPPRLTACHTGSSSGSAMRRTRSAASASRSGGSIFPLPERAALKIAGRGQRLDDGSM